VPSVLWRCWLGCRKGIRPVKNWVVRCWCGYLSGVRCRLAHAQLMPLPLTISCSSKIQIGFTFLVPAHPGSPGQRAVKRVCVCSFLNVLVVILTTVQLDRLCNILPTVQLHGNIRHFTCDQAFKWPLSDSVNYELCSYANYNLRLTG